MTGSDARREAIEAMVSADGWGYKTIHVDQLGAALDAIPAGVLARLAVERGGLELCGYVDHTLEPLVFGTPGELVTEVEHLHDGDQPVYRIVEDTDG